MVQQVLITLLRVCCFISLVYCSNNLSAQFPVACYNFDGSLINDDPSAGIANLDIIGNPGIFESGAAICFGTDSVYVFGQGDGLNLNKTNLPAQTYSLELFFKFTGPSASLSGRRRVLRFKAENDAGLYLAPDGRLEFQFTNNPLNVVFGTTIIGEGDWMNISITRDGTVVPPEIIIYLDGNEEIRIPTDNQTELLNDFKLFEDNSGGAPISKDENAEGKIDYLRFYAEALDATQVDNLFNASLIKSDILITPSASPDICIGESITLSASGGDGIYLWSTGETSLNITVSPLDTTIYWLESTTQTPCERKCFKTRDSLTVNVIQKPLTTLSISSPACVNSPVNVSYIGNADILTSSFNWNFAGGIPVKLPGQEAYDITWNSSGIKNLSLGITASSCFNDTLFSIQVFDSPTSTFSMPGAICSVQPAIINYTGSGTSSAIYTWNFDGGTATQIGTGQDYSVTWSTSGTKNVSLTVTENGCPSTITINAINVNTTPTSTFTLPNGVCVQNDLSLVYSGTADPLTATFNWNFDGATASKIPSTQNYTLNWATGGTKTISLTVTENGCTSTPTSTTVNVNNFSLFTITSNQNAICDTGSALVTFTGSSEPGATLNWNFDGGIATQIPATNNYNVTWALPGTKTVTLQIIGVLCPNDISSETLIVNQTPTADFTISSDPVCQLNITTITHTGTAGPNAVYIWDFDGGQFGKEPGIEAYKVFWDTGGAKTVSLTVNDNGCISTPVTQTITVNNDSNFDVDVVDKSCITDPVTVTFTGSAETGSTLIWDFDGGTFVSIGNEIYQGTWPVAGVKNISLLIEGVACPSDSTIKQVTVGTVPVPDFSFNNTTCLDQAATIRYNGDPLLGEILTWDFGGASSIDSVAFEEYRVIWSSIGTKSINVSIDNFGCVLDTVLQVIVNDVPLATFSLNDFVCIGDDNPVSYTGNGTSAATFNWVFGGGSPTPTSGLENYNLRWNSAGEKVLSLSVTENGCTSLFSDTVTVIAPETFNITSDIDIVCVGNNSLMTFAGIAETDAVYVWNFDDGIATQINGQQIYDVNWSIPGVKNVTLVVIGKYCVSDTINKTINVIPKPDPSFTVDPAVCIGLPVSVTYNGVPDPAWVFNWGFDGGIPTKILGEDYNVVWNTGGIKVVTLSIDNNGCLTEVFTDSIKVNNHAQFSITPDRSVICVGELVNFKFIGSREVGATLSWDFGDGTLTFISEEEYDVVWNNTGIKNVELIILGVTCPNDTATKTITIKTKPDPSFTVTPVVCLQDSATVTFTGQADPGSTFNWDFGVGGFIKTPGLEEYKVNWPDLGAKPITLQVDNGGCLSEVSIDSIYVVDLSIFSAAEDSVCQNSPFMIDFSNNTLGSSILYSWDFDGGTLISGSGLGPYELSWPDFGQKQVSLSIQGVVCGSGSLIKDVFVEENVLPAVTIQVDTLYCSADEVLITPAVINQGQIPEYKWFVNDKFITTDTIFANPDLLDGDRVFTILTSSIECVVTKDVVSNEVILNISDFAFQGTITSTPNPLCPEDSTSLSIEGNYTGIQWQSSSDTTVWTDIIGATSNQIFESPLSDIYYRTIVTDSICFDVSPPELVEVIEISPIDAGPDRTIREGFSTILHATNGSNFSWDPPLGLSDPFVADPVASPLETITYMLDGITNEGCPNTDSVTVFVTPKLGIPNTFTPNGDGVNDIWEIEKIEEYPQSLLFLYNRWGKLILTSQGYGEPWDGKFNGQDVPVSTYYYVLDLKDGFPNLKGSITVLR